MTSILVRLASLAFLALIGLAVAGPWLILDFDRPGHQPGCTAAWCVACSQPLTARPGEVRDRWAPRLALQSLPPMTPAASPLLVLSTRRHLLQPPPLLTASHPPLDKTPTTPSTIDP